MASLYNLWALTGGGIASLIMMLIWKPDPPPFSRFLVVLIAGIVSGLVGGMWMHGMLANSNPMAGIVGAASLSAIVSGGISARGSMGVKTAG